MSGIATAAVVGGAASYLAGSEAADAQSDSDRARARQAELDRKFQFDLFERNENRDFGGEFGRLRGEYSDFLESTGEDPRDTVARYEAILDEYEPVRELSRENVIDLFENEDGMLESRLGASGETGDARLRGAEVQRQNIKEGLQRILSRTRSGRSTARFGGGSSFDRQKMAQATVGAYNQAAEAESRAEVQNALDRQRILEEIQNQRLAAADLPYQLAEMEALAEDMPMRAAGNRLSGRMDPLSRFRTGNTFNPIRLADYSPRPVASDMGLAAGAISGVASGLGDYFSTQQMISALNNQNQTANINSGLDGFFGPLDAGNPNMNYPGG